MDTIGLLVNAFMDMARSKMTGNQSESQADLISPEMKAMLAKRAKRRGGLPPFMRNMGDAELDAMEANINAIPWQRPGVADEGGGRSQFFDSAPVEEYPSLEQQRRFRSSQPLPMLMGRSMF